MENGAKRSSVDVRELGERADEIVREVQVSGEEVVVTIEGEPVAALRGVRPRSSDRTSPDREQAWQELLAVAEKIRQETPAGAESATEALIRMREERHRSVAGLDRDS